MIYCFIALSSYLAIIGMICIVKTIRMHIREREELNRSISCSKRLCRNAKNGIVSKIGKFIIQKRRNKNEKTNRRT